MPVSEVYNEDCMIGMARYPDKFFDLAIVDPPYGIDFGKFNRTNTDSMGNNYKANKYKNGDWDKCAPDGAYFTELKRVSKEQIIWGGNYYFDKLGNSKGLICWYKHQPVDNFSDCEYAWNSLNKPAKVFDFPYYGNIEGKTQATQKIHPTQKPIKLYEWILQNYATCKKCNNTGIIHEMLGEKWMGTQAVPCEHCDIADSGVPKILDTHMGSQSSRIASYLMGFDYYGWEIDAEYFEKGNKRFKDITSQQQLF